MKKPMHQTRSAVRATVAVTLLAAALSACDQDKLLTVPTPDVVLPQDIADRSALPSAFAAAVGDFQLAYSGGYGGQLPLLDYNEGLDQITALMPDEKLYAQTLKPRLVDDPRSHTQNYTTNTP